MSRGGRGDDPTEDGDEQPYETTAPNAYEWTEAAYELLINGKLGADLRTAHGVSSVAVNGSCPRCDHEVNFESVLTAVVGETASTLGSEGHDSTDAYIPVDVSCSCQKPHPGRPATVKTGCGIGFTIEVAV